MKRSMINSYIREAEKFLKDSRFPLPPWAAWTPGDWKKNLPLCTELFKSNLGWDLTDFGSGDYLSRGLLLITVRNGNDSLDWKPYAEKIMIVKENQETPWHFHWSKTEDIINRGGGNLMIQLSQSDSKENFSAQPVVCLTDGIKREVSPGETLCLMPGESITLQQGIYHRFYAQEGKGMVLAGEVSMTNDDSRDNRFYDNCGRFPDIQEDEPVYRLLVGDYEKLQKGELS